MIGKLKEHKKETFGLIAILLLAGFFYFYNISQKGLFEWDEGFHLMVSSSYVSAFKVFVSHLLNPDISLNDLAKQTFSGPVYFTANSRPVLIFLDFLAFLFFGKNDYVAFAANGIVSLISILVLYFLAKFVTNNKFIAFLGAFLFAVSGHQIFFARTAVTQISAGLLVLIMSFFYIKTLVDKENLFGRIAKKNLIWCGVFAGLALLAHPSVLAILALAGIFEAFFMLFWRKQSLFIFLKRSLFCSIPFAAVITITEVLFRVRNLLFVKLGYPINLSTFLGDFFAYLQTNTTTGQPRQPMFYIEVIKHFNGWLFLVLFLIAIIFFFYKKWYRNPILTFLFFIPSAALLAYGLNDEAAARILSVFSGFIAFIIALFLYEIFKAPKCYKLIGWGLLFLFLIVQLPKDWQIINLKTGYKEAAMFIDRTGVPPQDIYSESWPILAFYLNKKVQIIDKNAKIIYYISDWHSDNKFILNEIPKEQWELLASFDNQIERFPGIDYENIKFYDKPDFDKIKIYKIKIY